MAAQAVRLRLSIVRVNAYHRHTLSCYAPPQPFEVSIEMGLFNRSGRNESSGQGASSVPAKGSLKIATEGADEGYQQRIRAQMERELEEQRSRRPAP